MPTQRRNKSSYMSSKNRALNNAQSKAQKNPTWRKASISSANTYKKPTMRGAFPKAVRFSMADEGITNARLNYNRGLNLNKTAYASQTNGVAFTKTSSLFTRNKKNSANPYSASFNKSFNSTIRLESSANPKYRGRQTVLGSAYEGNAAISLDNAASAQPEFTPKPSLIPDKKPQKKNKTKTNKNINRSIFALKGKSKGKSALHSSAFSPLMVTCAKFVASIVVVCAAVCFVRVGISAATVSSGIESQQLSNQITQELNTKNSLEVKDSALSNSSRVRAEANKLSMVAPDHIENINLGQDVLSYNGDEVSLVDSLNRLASGAK